MLDQRRFRVLYGAIVVAAGLFRIAYVLVAKSDDPVVGDQIYYSRQAVTIANGNWFEDPFVPGAYAADHPPLTALAVAPVSWSDDDPLLAQRLAMAVYGTGLVAGLGLLARWLFDRRVALTATALAAVYANFWMNDGLVMSETLAAAGVVAVLFAAYRYDLARAGSAAAVLGVAIGLAGLVRAELLLFGPLLAVPLVLAGRRAAPHHPTRVGHLALAALAAVAVVSPWVIRNQLRFDEPTTMSTQDGLTLIGTNCPAAFEGSGRGFWHLSCALAVDVPADADQSERSAIYRREAFDFLADHVDELPAVVAARLGRGLSVWKTEAMGFLNEGEGRERWASTIGLWQYWVLVPLAAYGLWRWPSGQPRWPAVVAVAVSVLTIAALYGIPRFRIAGEITVVLGAAVTVDVISTALRGRLGRVRPPTIPTPGPPPTG